MFNAGAMPYLIQGMKSDIEGMRAACAQTARNIYVLGTATLGRLFHSYGNITRYRKKQPLIAGSEWSIVCCLRADIAVQMSSIDEHSRRAAVLHSLCASSKCKTGVNNTPNIQFSYYVILGAPSLYCPPCSSPDLAFQEAPLVV